ncbi:AraC-like ligand-binding domain-containing protein [Methylobacterium sp. P5_C11]
MQPKPILQLTGESPGPRQADDWRDAVAPFWDFTIRKEDLSDFRGQSRVRHLGTAIVCRARASGLRFVREPALVARMGVDHIVAHMRVSGQSRIAIGGWEQDCAPGDICILDLSRPLSAASTDYEAVTVVLPRPLFGGRESALDALHGAVIRGATPFGRMLSDHLRSLSAHATGFSDPEAAAAAEATAALLGAAALGLPRDEERGGQLPERAPLLLAIRRFIEAELSASDLSAETIGRRFGVSRSALYRLFVPLGGVSGYIRQRRLARAYRDLATGDGRFARIADVAYRWRFESPAHFTQAFRAEFGCAPRDVRAQAEAAKSAEVGSAEVGSAEAGSAAVPPARTETWADFYDWVLKLAA